MQMERVSSKEGKLYLVMVSYQDRSYVVTDLLMVLLLIDVIQWETEERRSLGVCLGKKRKASRE